MAVFAKLRDPDNGLAIVECVYNRELEAEVDYSYTFFVLSAEVHEKFGIDYDQGEVLIYAPNFMPEYGCPWVAQTADLDFLNIEGLD